MKLVSLSQGRHAMVDDEDYERVTHFGKWCFSTAHGAHIRTKKISISMHRFIMGAPKGLIVDHKNGNRLDNRKENLRFCSHADNMRNRAVNKNTQGGFKGIYKNGRRWSARIQFNGKQIYLGIFDTPQEAAKKYNEVAPKYFGEFARLNEV